MNGGDSITKREVVLARIASESRKQTSEPGDAAAQHRTRALAMLDLAFALDLFSQREAERIADAVQAQETDHFMFRRLVEGPGSDWDSPLMGAAESAIPLLGWRDSHTVDP
jgi:hypothetical protein